jgi:hypothetical protein
MAPFIRVCRVAFAVICFVSAAIVAAYAPFALASADYPPSTTQAAVFGVCAILLVLVLIAMGVLIIRPAVRK